MRTAAGSQPVFLSPAQLHQLLNDATTPVHLLDVRWVLGRDDGEERYTQGHLPEAVYVDLDTQLAGTASPRQGRHPLPEETEFSHAMKLWGLNPGEIVVVYDDSAGTSAARAWWLLRYAGLEQVYLLDGGYQAWVEAGYPVQAGVVIPTPGTATAHYGQQPTVSLEELGQHALLVDARAAERYRGEVEPVDPRAGHIPGAVNLPTSALIADGRLVSEDALAQHFHAIRVDTTPDAVAYCGSGVTACFLIAAAAHAGHQLSLYPGSFSQYAHQTQLPVVTETPDKAEHSQSTDQGKAN